jgi:hypothetical protein
MSSRNWLAWNPSRSSLIDDRLPIDGFHCHHDLISAILDFAEWGFDVPEKDISDILKDAAVKDVPSWEEPLVRSYEETPGFKTDRRRLKLGLSENALYGFLISSREGNIQAMTYEREALLRHLGALGYDLAQHTRASIETSPQRP